MIQTQQSVGAPHRGIVLAVAALAALFLSSCMTPALPSSTEAGLSFQTRPMELPDDLDWSKRSVAHELINTKDLAVVLSGGDKPVSDEKWRKYRPPLPYLKNIERNLLFDGSFFIRSPSAPDGAEGSARYIFRDVSGYTWVELAKPVSVDFVPAGQKTDMLRPSPGHLVFKIIKKAQVLRWSFSIYQLTDNKGNYFVMHAYENPSGPTTEVALPEGWSLIKVELAEPLVISPSQGGYYNVVGDCLGQGYHQYIFADTEYPAHG